MDRGEVTPQPTQVVQSGTPLSRTLRLLLDILIWKLLSAIGAPFHRVAAFYASLWRSCWSLTTKARQWLYTVSGWLSAPPSWTILRHLGTRYLETKRWHFGVAGILAVALFRAFYRKWKEWTSEHYRQVLRLKRTMDSTTDYETWARACTSLENLEGADGPDGMGRWKRETRLYDRKLLEERVEHLRCVEKEGDVHEMMFVVRADLLRNLGNMCNSELHEAHIVVPKPIQEYTVTVQQYLEYLTNYKGADLLFEDKLAFLREIRHAFGRTALVLSGGAALGAFHVGVVKALYEHNLLPRVISGSSVGAIVAAAVATRNEDELKLLFKDTDNIDLSFFSNGTAAQFVTHFLLNGTLQSVDVFQKKLRHLIGDATFLQAFMHSGRILNVAVCPADTNEPPRVLNYLSAPNVLVWSAVSCSSAFPFLFLPQELLARNRRGELVKFTAESVQQTERRWRDGSLEEDLPMRTLSEMFNVNYFLVSQTNPHIVPALNLKKRFNRKLGDILETEWKHRCRQAMSIWPALSFLKCFSQPWEGDVTIVLPSSYMQLKKAIMNPSKKDLLEACQQGERQTWCKLSAIKANCGIELTIDACLATLASKAKETRLTEARLSSVVGRAARPIRARTPSWINMQAYGLDGVASDENLERYSSAQANGIPYADGVPSPRDSGVPQSPRHSTSPLPSRPFLADLRASEMRRVLSVSALSDHMKAPGVNLLTAVQEMESNYDSSPEATTSEGTPSEGTPSCHPRRSTDGVSSSSTTTEGCEWMPPVPGTEPLDYADAFLDSPDTPIYSRAHPSMSAFDCCDRSVNIWQSLLPLVVTSRGGPLEGLPGGQGLDVIAP